MVRLMPKTLGGGGLIPVQLFQDAEYDVRSIPASVRFRSSGT